MATDSTDLTELSPVATNDVIIVDDPTAVTNSVVVHKSLQYDDTKAAPTCLVQFYAKYNVATNSASCLICHDQVKKSGDSTYNFVRHVKRHHLDAYNAWMKRVPVEDVGSKLKQQSIKNALVSPRGTRYTNDNPRQIELSKMVTNDLIIGLALPLSIVERPEFVQAMRTVDPRFVVPSRRSLCRDVLPHAFAKVENELKRICKENRFVSLTLDIWTDRRMRSFFAVTLHLIEQCLFKSHLLAFKCLSGSHTGDNLLKEYEEITAQYGIEEKVVRLITDNASNNIKAFASLVLPGFEPYFEESPDDVDADNEQYEDEEETEEEKERSLHDLDDRYDFPFGTDELLRLPCFTHTLQLVVSDGFKESICTKAAMMKVSSIAKFSHKSTAMAERLDRDGFHIPMAVVTRWNSQYYTAAKTIEIPSDKLNEYLRELKKDSLVLSQRDIAILNEFISVFALFAEVCTRADGTKIYRGPMQSTDEINARAFWRIVQTAWLTGRWHR